MTKFRNAILLAVAGLALQMPLLSQQDLSGEWGGKLHEDQPWRATGPDIGEYPGLPINTAARIKAQSWNPSVYSLLERQCIPFAADFETYIGNMRIWKEVDQTTQEVIAWHTRVSFLNQERTFWMDGRPEPSPLEPYTWQGFSTAKWEGNILTVTTTHLKMAQIERNGVPRSDRATLTEHYIRHGQYLTVSTIVNDPVYLTEPLIRTRDYIFDPVQELTGYSCRPTVELDTDKARDYVPHYLPDRNPSLHHASEHYRIPFEAMMGGAETMYPEYMIKLKTLPLPAPNK